MYVPTHYDQIYDYKKEGHKSSQAHMVNIMDDIIQVNVNIVTDKQTAPWKLNPRKDNIHISEPLWNP